MEKRQFNRGFDKMNGNAGFRKKDDNRVKTFKKPGFVNGKFGKKPMVKKPQWTVKEGVTLSKEVIMELRCTNTDYFNSKIMTLGSYTAGSTNKMIKAGDLVAKCKWKLAEAGIENKEGKVETFKLMSNAEIVKVDHIPYMITYMFQEINGKFLPKLYVQTPDDNNLKKIKYIALKPIGEISGVIKVRETEVVQNEEPVKKLIVKFSQDTFNKMKALRESLNIPSNAQLIRHLIDQEADKTVCAEDTCVEA